MFRLFKFILCFSFIGASLSCQQDAVPERLLTPHPPLNKKLAKMVTANDQALSPLEASSLENVTFLDSRETVEYNISHFPNALQVGYDQPDFSVLSNLDKEQPIVVYCTIGYRSERMAEQIRSKGFKNVFNLYGSIYAWSLADLPLEDQHGQPTKMVHTYNKKWGSYFPDNSLKVH